MFSSYDKNLALIFNTSGYTCMKPQWWDLENITEKANMEHREKKGATIY